MLRSRCLRFILILRRHLLRESAEECRYALRMCSGIFVKLFAISTGRSDVVHLLELIVKWRVVRFRATHGFGVNALLSLTLLLTDEV